MNLRCAKDVVREVAAELDRAGVPHRKDAEVGVMIEVPQQ